jgi:maltose alpha-D-glucosyltransferase / alpha-amylase
MKDQWYHNTIVYSLDVATYKDGNGDGIGDFEGLVSKLDYLSGLGINCVWLRPFFPSPLVDDGYDVVDYYDIDPRFGNLGDFVNFVIKARSLGIRVIIDLVVNHTSDRHEWFQKARADKNSKFRDYYIWKDRISRKDKKHDNMLGDGGIWEYDEAAAAYYMHHFYKEQPDLNISNPDVRKEIIKIMGFWLQLGVSGFRVDAAHIIVHESKNQVFGMLEEMREFLDRRNHEAILIAEANVEPNDLEHFFGSGNNRMHMLFNFYTNKNLFLSMARESPEPLISSLRETQEINCGWVNFLRTHDELNLEMLSGDERDEVFEIFAPDEEMRMFGHGIRRRLPPMLDGNRVKMELLYTAMFSLPGLPLINYGEEIAMGDDLSLEGRASVRTVMQWDGLENAGFSSAGSGKLAHSLIDFGRYHYKKVNVSIQQKNPDSFLNWMERLIIARKHSPTLGFGEITILDNNADSVLSFCSTWNSEAVIIVLNFSSDARTVQLQTGDREVGTLTEIFSDRQYNTVESIKHELEIAAHGYRWLKTTLVT